jgi:hypothetical protein
MWIYTEQLIHVVERPDRVSLMRFSSCMSYESKQRPDIPEYVLQGGASSVGDREISLKDSVMLLRR